MPGKASHGTRGAWNGITGNGRGGAAPLLRTGLRPHSPTARWAQPASGGGIAACRGIYRPSVGPIPGPPPCGCPSLRSGLLRCARHWAPLVSLAPARHAAALAARSGLRRPGARPRGCGSPRPRLLGPPWPCRRPACARRSGAAFPPWGGAAAPPRRSAAAWARRLGFALRLPGLALGLPLGPGRAPWRLPSLLLGLGLAPVAPPRGLPCRPGPWPRLGASLWLAAWGQAGPGCAALALVPPARGPGGPAARFSGPGPRAHWNTRACRILSRNDVPTERRKP